MVTMGQIEEKTRAYAKAREEVAIRVNEIEDEMAAIKKRHMKSLKMAVSFMAETMSELKGAIEDSPELFEKPRTIIMHGIKVGYMKGRGELMWDDDDKVVGLIRKYFPEQAEVLVKTVDMPIKKALSQLSVQDLKRIGVTVIETGDQTVIKSTDSEIDKFVSALMKEDEIKEAKAA